MKIKIDIINKEINLKETKLFFFISDLDNFNYKDFKKGVEDFMLKNEDKILSDYNSFLNKKTDYYY
jgi:hypothetical protein